MNGCIADATDRVRYGEFAEGKDASRALPMEVRLILTLLIHFVYVIRPIAEASRCAIV